MNSEDTQQSTGGESGVSVSLTGSSLTGSAFEIVDMANQLAGSQIDPDQSTTVSFYGRGLKLNNEEDAAEIAEAIEACPNLVTLNLEGNTLGIEAAKAVGRALETKSSLKRCLLKDLFTSRSKQEIPPALDFLMGGIRNSGAQLEELDLSDNAFGPIGMKALVDFLKSPTCSTVKSLRLNNNGLGIDGGKMLASGLENMTELRVFVCGRNRLASSADKNVDSSHLIGEVLSRISTLEVIEIPQNGIRAIGIVALARAIESNKESLRVINFNDNIMSGQAGQAIAESLKSCRQLEVINFGDCLLKRSGATAICKALTGSSSLSTLRDLILSGNEIGGQEAIETIVEMIKSAEKPLENLRIDLSSNCFGSGLEALQEEIGSLVGDFIADDDEGTDDGEEDEEEDEEEEEGEENEEGEIDEEAENEKENLAGDSFKQTPKKGLDSSLIEEAQKLLQHDSSNVDDLCQEFVKISVQGYDPQTNELAEEAHKLSEELLKAALNKETNEYLSVNALLCSLGFMKPEDKEKRLALEDLRGPLTALTKSVNTLSPTHKQVLQFFMSKPNKLADQTGGIKHNLMRALFQ